MTVTQRYTILLRKEKPNHANTVDAHGNAYQNSSNLTGRIEDMTYRPLPDNLELRPSEIHGYGVFTLEDIPAGQMLGLSHINAPELIRTPLGGYINHSMNPNCIRILEGNRWYLQAIADISDGEEITLMYKGYKP